MVVVGHFDVLPKASGLRRGDRRDYRDSMIPVGVLHSIGDLAAVFADVSSASIWLNNAKSILQ
jgi:hypothetical protein